MATGDGSGGGGGTAGAVRAGGAFVELMTKDDTLKAGLDKAKKLVEGWAAKVALIGAGVAGAGAAITAPLTKLFWGAVEGAADAGKLADKWGVPVEKMSALAYATRLSNEELDRVLDGFSRHIHEAAQGGGELGEAFAAVGLNAAELAEMTKPDQILAFADAMHETANATQRVALETKLGGRAMVELDGILRQGSQAIRDRMEKGKRLGVTYTEGEVKNARTINGAWKDASLAIETAFGRLGRALLEPLAGPIQAAAKLVEDVAVSVRQFVERNQELVTVAFVAGAALVAVGTALVALGGAVALASTAVAGLVTAWGAVVAVVGFLVSPLGLAVAALAGLVALVIGASGAWGQFVAAVGSGDISLAFKVAWDAVRLTWAKTVFALTLTWNSFKNEVVEGWHAVSDAAAYAWGRVTGVGDEALRHEIDAARRAREEARKADEESARRDIQYAAARLAFDRIRGFKDSGNKSSADLARQVAAQAGEALKIGDVRGGFMSGGWAQAFGASSVLVAILKESQKAHAATAGNTKGILAELKKEEREKGEEFQ